MDYQILSFFQKTPLPLVQTCSLYDLLTTNLIPWTFIFLIIALTLPHLKKFILLTYLNLLFTTFFTEIILKPLFHRLRPFTTHPNLNPPGKLPTSFSFPSGQTTAVFSTIFFLYLLTHQPKLYFLLLPFSLLVGICRLVLLVHYPTDILGGFLIGHLLSLISFYSFRHFNLLS